MDDEVQSLVVVIRFLTADSTQIRSRRWNAQLLMRSINSYYYYYYYYYYYK